MFFKKILLGQEKKITQTQSKTEEHNIKQEISQNKSHQDILFNLFASIAPYIPYSDLQNTVMYGGNPESKIMVIGEAPGADEVVNKEPFVGKSGKLLQQMFDYAGLFRKDIYIANVVPWRPPMNRPPMPEEIQISRPVLYKHIEMINPRILILIGSIAYKTFTNSKSPISKVRGQWITHPDYPHIKVIATFHPSFLLRAPQNKKYAWYDMIDIVKTAIEMKINIETKLMI